MSWLWRGDVSSPASYEKALSKLSGQIATASLSLDSTRARGRRIKALWTLWTTLTYLLSLLILVLVIGPQTWTIYHYGGVLGGPFAIYGVRTLIATFFDWQIARKQSYLQHLQKQRDGKIADLKKATKYDSTQELLQKYGGAPPKETSPAPSPSNKRKPTAGNERNTRTGLPPPPTANIQPRPMTQSPEAATPMSQHPLPSDRARAPSLVIPDTPGFAPNAFAVQPSFSTQPQTPHWYDRILDVMLGEDEMLARNRLVLLCQKCRAVNGQAPPGVKTLDELGKWRCMNCGAWNGQESEAASLIKQITDEAKHASHEDRKDIDVETKRAVTPDDPYLGEDTGKATGTETEGSASKRVTRSAGETPLDGL